MSYDTFGRRTVRAGLTPKGIIRGDGRDERGALWVRGESMQHLPALWDAATRGVLLDQIRKETGDVFGSIVYDERWRWFGSAGRGEPLGFSEEEALVVAYENAKRRTS